MGWRLHVLLLLLPEVLGVEDWVRVGGREGPSSPRRSLWVILHHAERHLTTDPHPSPPRQLSSASMILLLLLLLWRFRCCWADLCLREPLECMGEGHAVAPRASVAHIARTPPHCTVSTRRASLARLAVSRRRTYMWYRPSSSGKSAVPSWPRNP